MDNGHYIPKLNGKNRKLKVNKQSNLESITTEISEIELVQDGCN